MSAELQALAISMNLAVEVIEAYSKAGMPTDKGLVGAINWIPKNLPLTKKIISKLKGDKKEKEATKKKEEKERKKAKTAKPTPPSTPPPLVEVLLTNGSGDLPDGEMSIAEAKRRKEVAGALQAELNLAKDRELVANIDDLMEEFSNALVNVRASLTSLSSRMSGILAHQDEEAVRTLIDKEIIDTLEALSNYDN